MPIASRVTIVLNSNAYQIQTGRQAFAVSQPLQPQLVDNLPDVPALPETLLLMELKLYDFSVDLGEVSQLVQRDLGATLQILRLASREYGASDNRPIRVEDCISCLGLEACLQAAGQRTILSERCHRSMFEFWAHSRDVAQAARTIALTSGGAVHPDEAGLVGLFHALGAIPALLGWEWRDRTGGGWTDRALRMAERWSLPACVGDYFMELHQPELPGTWTEMIRAAHRSATRSFADCPLYQPCSLRLLRKM
jgi:hypothetical protein